MRLKFKIAALFPLALSLCVGQSMAQIVDSPPFRDVLSVNVSADEITSTLSPSISTIRIDMLVEDVIQLTTEAWEVVHTTNFQNGSSVSSLNVDGNPRYVIQQAYIAGQLYASVQTVAGYDWVSFADYNGRPLYAELLASIDGERQFILDVVSEFREDGTFQGVAPAFQFPEVNAVEVPFPPIHTGVDCREEAESLYGPKPTDCEGAIDAYRCCLWEYFVDAAEDACECDKLPWYKKIPCHAAIALTSGIDGIACTIALPIPGI